MPDISREELARIGRVFFQALIGSFFEEDLARARKEGSMYDSVKDSGVRQEFDTGSRRDTRIGKGRYDLIPPLLLERLAKHFENGANKYGDNNWKKGQPLSRYLDSALRHIVKGVAQGLEDEDHLTAAIWNLQAIMWTLEEIRAGRMPASLLDLPYAGPKVVHPEPGAEAYNARERALKNVPLQVTTFPEKKT